MSGRELYERIRRHEPDREHWDWLDQEVREFWNKLATILRKETTYV